jgi:hypothetical protein
MPLSQPIMSLEEALVVWDSVLAEDETSIGCQNSRSMKGVDDCERDMTYPAIVDCEEVWLKAQGWLKEMQASIGADWGRWRWWTDPGASCQASTLGPGKSRGAVACSFVMLELLQWT